MSKKKSKRKSPEGVYDVDAIREQLAKGKLKGDSIKTLEFLLDEYNILEAMLHESWEVEQKVHSLAHRLVELTFVD